MNIKRLTTKFIVVLMLMLGLAACSTGLELSHEEVQIYAGQDFNPLNFIKSDIEDESKISITNNIRKDIPGTYEIIYDLNGSKKTLKVKVLDNPIILKDSKVVIEKGESFDPKNVLSYGSQQNDIKIISNVDVEKPGEYIVIYAFEGIEKTIDVVVEGLEIELIEPSIAIDLGSNFASMDYIKSNFPSSINLKIENKVDLTKPGNYTVIYSYGETSKTLSVKVNDVSPFLRTSNVTLKYGSAFDPKSYLIDSDKSNANIEIDNKVDTSKAGTYLVTYKLGTVSKTLSVTVSNPPTASTPVAPTNPTQPSNPTTPTQPTTPTVNKLSVVSLTSPVTQNEHATITVKGTPNKTYSITVMYKSGPSTAAGLESKTADSNGVVSWTWKIGARTSEGKWKITISGDGETVSTYITVQ